MAIGVLTRNSSGAGPPNEILKGETPFADRLNSLMGKQIYREMVAWKNGKALENLAIALLLGICGVEMSNR